MKKPITRQWLDHWIGDLVSQEIVNKCSFDDWISGFEERYSQEDIDYMKVLWMNKKEKRYELHADGVREF